MSYSKSQLFSMNCSPTWNNCITIHDDTFKKSKSNHFNLYPTGYADLNGRKYVAIPTDVNITPQIKQLYNII